MVARAAELAVPRAAVERASRGQASTVVVSGDAGVGKSRLVEELVRAAQEDGALVLLGRCVDVGEGELAARHRHVPRAPHRRDAGRARRAQRRAAVAALTDGFAYLSTHRVRGATALRLCPINPRTSRADVDRRLDRLATLAQGAHA